MRCRSCGMASIHDDLAIHAWHCLNCGHVNEAVNGQAAWAATRKHCLGLPMRRWSDTQIECCGGKAEQHGLPG
jgi:transcription initiation factor TFIIIB Brf1 subunit/transcription initiation factor TFIIB